MRRYLPTCFLPRLLNLFLRALCTALEREQQKRVVI